VGKRERKFIKTLFKEKREEKRKNWYWPQLGGETRRKLRGLKTGNKKEAHHQNAGWCKGLKLRTYSNPGGKKGEREGE